MTEKFKPIPLLVGIRVVNNVRYVYEKRTPLLDGGLRKCYDGIPKGQEVEFTHKETGIVYKRVMSRELALNLYAVHPVGEPNKVCYVDCSYTGKYTINGD